MSNTEEAVSVSEAFDNVKSGLYTAVNTEEGRKMIVKFYMLAIGINTEAHYRVRL